MADEESNWFSDSVSFFSEFITVSDCSGCNGPISFSFFASSTVSVVVSVTEDSEKIQGFHHFQLGVGAQEYEKKVA